jgi:hypothetical protein
MDRKRIILTASLIGVSISLPFYYLLFTTVTKSDVLNVQIAPEVFATILVTSSIILFEYMHLTKDAVERVFSPTKGDLFFALLLTSLVSSLNGLFASAFSIKGAWILFYLFISAYSTIATALVVGLVYCDLSIEYLNILKRKLEFRKKSKITQTEP